MSSMVPSQPELVPKMEAALLKAPARKQAKVFKSFLQDVVDANPAALAAYHSSMAKAKKLAAMELPEKLVVFSLAPRAAPPDVVSAAHLFADDDDEL